MPLGIAEGRNLLTGYEFKTLFIEKLGWNRNNARLVISVDGRTFALSAIAEKCGMAAFACDPGSDGRFPDYPTRRKIERQVEKSAHEHLIIFTDAKQILQVWQWVRRDRGKPAACREYSYHAGQAGEWLIQKIRLLTISLEEEENLTLPDVTGRARKAFDIERTTKKFYDRFKIEHAEFLEFLDGIPDEEMERWYVSVMLNRLMFIYFIQKKGFLGGGDIDYLKHKLTQCRTELGKDHYYSEFLCPLFFEGFAKKKEDRSDKAKRLLGEVPYLNGGIFLPHQIEQAHGKTIAISDKAFEKLFEFFDTYHWHLDERPLKKADEINPDVLGYIFEKYINQKQMGAYYTKEDITEYIGKNTVIPFLFDSAREKYKVAFEGERSVWRLLQEDPDRYIYKVVRHGMTWDYRPKIIDKNEGCPLPRPIPLPPAIEEGVDPVKPNLIERRRPWNKPAPPNYALPTEIWREVVARRQRYEEVKAKLESGEASSINDLITYNLDIRQFAQDVIENAEVPELLAAFWKAVGSITILDPTCGSGAFLFAALNILDPLYEACLERMRFFLEEWGENGKKNQPDYYKLFTDTLKRVEEHPNHRYFVLKSSIVNNLYGVDIMEEAVEICKLRLFLKLVAQIEHVKDIEPLPDIDFNIRAGNTLVGFAKLEEVKAAAERESTGQARFVFEDIEANLKRIERDAETADLAFCKFRKMQTEQGISPRDFFKAKDDLRSRLKKLTDELDRFLENEYRSSKADLSSKSDISRTKKPEDRFEEWKKSHQPFHWFAEFYGILKSGGFDVIIGNPPYVVYAESKVGYGIKQDLFRTYESKNLFSYVFERSILLAAKYGRVSLIVQLTALSAERMSTLQALLLKRGWLWTPAFPRRPESMFDGVEMPVTILLSSTFGNGLASTKINRFYTEERPSALSLMVLQPHNLHIERHRIAKLGTKDAVAIFKKLIEYSETLESLAVSSSKYLLYYQEACRYWVKACVDFPYFKRNGQKMVPPHGRTLAMINSESCTFAACLLNSSLFYWFYSALSDCEHINDSLIRKFPLPTDWERVQWSKHWGKLSASLEKNATKKIIQTKQGHRIEYNEMNASLSKPIIDEIDIVLARHYGFTDEELDFIINYDIKYRMGQEAVSADTE